MEFGLVEAIGFCGDGALWGCGVDELGGAVTELLQFSSEVWSRSVIRTATGLASAGDIV